MAFAAVGQVAGKIGVYAAEKVEKKFGYFKDYKTNVKNLKKEVQNLQDKKKRVQRQIDAAISNLEIIEDDVQNWVGQVDEITSDTDKFLEADQEKANHRCFNGWCINLWARYKFGKEAFKKAREIEKLQEKANFETVSYTTPLPEIESSSSTKNFTAFESRKSLVKGIMEALDDESTCVIGICGMGGVGKTTIVEEVCRQAKAEKKFDKVVMVVVSQTPNLAKIQGKIAHELNLVLETRDESERPQALWARIKAEKKILVVLDDIWDKLELIEKVGIPFGEDHKGCKILLTSRRKDVYNKMNAQKIFSIGGEIVDSTDLNPIAREVARECGGLPIAIVTVGRALMKNRSKDVWIDAARRLKKYEWQYLFAVPPSIQLLTTLQTLCLDYCQLGDDISIIGTLKGLEILSLYRSNIKEVPRHFTQLTHLKLFDLRFCHDLTQISPGVISSLHKLEELYIGTAFTHWAVEGEDNSRNNVSLSELKSLSQLTSLCLSVPNANMIPDDLRFEKLIRLRNIFSVTIAKGLVQLKQLSIRRCAMVEAVVEDAKGEETVLSIDKIVFPHLYEIHLEKLDSLTCFFTGCYAVEFPLLEELLIYDCPKMETFGHGVQMTPNLQKVYGEYDDERIWMGDLNATVQHIFNRKNVKTKYEVQEIKFIDHQPLSCNIFTIKLNQKIQNVKTKYKVQEIKFIDHQPPFMIPKIMFMRKSGSNTTKIVGSEWWWQVVAEDGGGKLWRVVASVGW
ncbi:hypothetical protein HYC85_031576 [Camellia sinensis]|uniref:AAA+ ATPase domain-containing protein n=1 Tax=Camellia sinensis TaxID=4442 RepID=A0A7J7FQW5_CAMSI|nr:hypothetical protein HYC85_031576 [Camellia sinensis]